MILTTFLSLEPTCLYEIFQYIAKKDIHSFRVVSHQAATLTEDPAFLRNWLALQDLNLEADEVNTRLFFNERAHTSAEEVIPFLKRALLRINYSRDDVVSRMGIFFNSPLCTRSIQFVALGKAILLSDRWTLCNNWNPSRFQHFMILPIFQEHCGSLDMSCKCFDWGKRECMIFYSSNERIKEAIDKIYRIFISIQPPETDPKRRHCRFQ